MPKRAREGRVRKPSLVVAPTRVKRGRLRRILLAMTLFRRLYGGIILHSGVQDLLHVRRKPVDFVDKENIVGFEV